MRDAQKLGANAIIAVRFAASSIATGVTEINAHGTAVIAEREA